MKVLILHGYSAENAGDGLLVRETMSMIREAYGETTELTVAASHPETFAGLDARVVDSSPSRSGYRLEYARLLRSLSEFDAVIGVGGGYLRAGYPKELLKTLLIHGPQLVAASRTSTPTIYLPQSVGPANALAARFLAKRIRAVDVFYVRDDRSFGEYAGAGVTRASDLAILSADPLVRQNLDIDDTPVISVRSVRGQISPLLVDFARQVGTFDGYVQSATAGNNDIEAMKSLGARRIISREELMSPTPGQRARVVVAVRLHGALMALRAGHFVIHLAYERKGFGAYQDLGLHQYVHNVNKFEPVRVIRQMASLLDDEDNRRRYTADLDAALHKSADARRGIIDELRALTGARSEAST